jgi:DNA polymerase-1
MKTLLLIDANSLIHRSFHALPPMTSAKGEPTQALYGTGSILLRLWRSEMPDYAAALFDRPEPTFRKEMYAEYKGHRPKAADELVAQIISAHNLFPEFGVKTFEAPGWEADDLIATLAHRFGGEKDLRVVILTGDLDTLQLVQGDKVVVRTFKKGISDTFIYNDAAVKSRYGLAPEQIADYKAFVGDASDNIKGVPGVGPKTAKALLLAHGSIEGILRAMESDPKLEAKLGKERETMLLSKTLVTLKDWDAMPVNSIEELRVSFEPMELAAFFDSYGMTSLRDRLLNTAPEPEAKPKRAAAPKKEEAPPSNQGSIF